MPTPFPDVLWRGPKAPWERKLCPTFIEVNAVDMSPDDIAQAQDLDDELTRIKTACGGKGPAKGASKKGGNSSWKGVYFTTSGDHWDPASRKDACGSNWWSRNPTEERF